MNISAEGFRPRTGRQGKVFWAILAGVFCAQATAGVILGLVEYRALVALQGGLPELRLIASSTPLPIGYGQRGVAQTVAECFAGLDAVHEYYPAEARFRAATACRTTAETILEDAPTHAGARQLLAETYLRLGLESAAVSALRDAALVAPNTNWLLRRRLALLARIDPAQRAAAVPDLGSLVAKLVSVPQSREWLAQNYVVHPEMRALIRAGAAALPEREAGQFLARVRALGAAAGQKIE